ncbi:MAG: thiamine biosynthesis protein, partial [Desulfobulbaceae bacterium]|nr:thiamine biosynthesis protein [Desulfobulbaceae bacterium]
MTKAIALFSGGLDSILACRVVARQGIEVIAVRFISPFFNYDLLSNPSYSSEIKAKYGIDVMLRDVSDEYIALLREPAHGYGKHFNPCLDCKIFMMTKARELMQELGAAFLISGEVLGQRPMSQRRDALQVVERDSGCDGI